MKKDATRILATLAAALTLSVTPSCALVDMLDRMAADGTLDGIIEDLLAGTTTESGEMYDEEGNPIYGYDGENAVYGYDELGAPIYSVANLTTSSTVPTWAPMPTAAPRPAGVRQAPPPAHARHNHGPRLRKPGEKIHRRATREERRKMREERRKHERPRGLFGHSDRPHDKRADRPGHHGKHADRPGRPDKRANKPGRPDKRAERPGRPDKRADKPARPDKRADKPGRPDKKKGRH
ncbi:MAG: hypothetical protein IJB33_05260 [Akkermansia sp.]|nr:hypothetical protein [Akkermansia sp.]